MAKSDLTAERLRKFLHYDPDTGIFTWIEKTSNRVKIGDIAGCSTAGFYVLVSVEGVLYRAHRLAWLYVHGAWPINHIDHINRCKTDNRLCNLRDVTSSTNQQNRVLASRNNKSGFIGVSANHYGFRARIVKDGKQTHLGTYKSPQEAHAAYVSAKSKFHVGDIFTA